MGRFVLFLRALLAAQAQELFLAAGTSRGNSMYDIKGSIEVDTNENSLFYWKGKMYVLENIPCYYSQHASKWFPEYANASYTRVRDFETGAIVSNISSSISFGFLSAFADYDTGRLWLFGSHCNRCADSSPSLPHGCYKDRGVQSWWSEDLENWETAPVPGLLDTYNVQVARVRSDAQSGLPPHKYVMMLECFSFAVSNGTDGNLTQGWMLLKSASPKAPCGGPSIRHNPLDNKYYVLTGGTVVDLVRTADFKTWEYSPNTPFIKPHEADAQVAPFAGFPAVAQSRGFEPMSEDFGRWDWNSNDADLCCMSDDVDDRAYVIWGAGTQGRAPKPPLTKDNHCTNVVAVANVSLPKLLMAHFN